MKEPEEQNANAPGGGEPILIGEVPDGAEAFLAADIALDTDRPVIFIARDDKRLARAAALLRFRLPEAELLRFPAWDCLPYDRVSPKADLVATRLATLARLLRKPKGGARRIVVTSINAFMQRVPHPDFIRALSLSLRPGQEIGFEAVQARLVDLGFERVSTVTEPGEFAPRGGILDFFPAGRSTPVRLDFFGDEIESVKSFDPLTQRSDEAIKGVVLGPVHEFVLSEDSVERFRTEYRDTFGRLKGEDPLYESVSAGRLHAGLDHWLPLFHEQMALLPDYLAGAELVFEPEVSAAKDARLETINDFYQARKSVFEAEKKDHSYKPIAPDRLYASEADWMAFPDQHRCWQLTSFTSPSQTDLPLARHQYRSVATFAEARQDPDRSIYSAVRDRTDKALGADRSVIIAGLSAGSANRLGQNLGEAGLEGIRALRRWEPSLSGGNSEGSRGVFNAVLPLERGFEGPGFVFYTEQDILGERISRPRRRRRSENFLTEVSGLATGDLVVHVEHGIGRYIGLLTIDLAGAAHDVLHIEYSGGDKLYVPVENIEVLSRFGDAEGVALDKLGGAAWQARKARVKERITRIARDLMRIAAERKLRKAEVLDVPESVLDEFSQTFPYSETDDQLNAIDDVVEDLASGRPMDRLVCGDVGFGKTEVAIRAAFVAAMAGQQVAIVAPTTLLARQHFMTFQARFQGLSLKLAQLSRLVPAKALVATKEALSKGEVDIVIGTHALLAESLEFANLGLLVIDEEQRFGVRQKERLKKLRQTVHVLTLTATPIPRTLQLALTGVKDLSLIATAPVDRLAVRTFIMPWDGVILREALMREQFRGGQSYVVCPRVRDLADMRERLQRIAPELKVTTAHGQMNPGELEDVMNAFYDRKFDILLATNIIESGLDIPTVNTIIIHRADMFGLSALYQLRGRVGRSKLRGYGYLTFDGQRRLTPDAQRRLEVMKTLDSLGAGFTLASHDLDIRGAGNLVGEEQSGHIKEVGIELYQQMLEEAVSEVQLAEELGVDPATGELRQRPDDDWVPSLNTGIAVYIPEDYVEALDVRLGLYRRVGMLRTKPDIDAFLVEVEDRFGPIPEPVLNLLKTLEFKIKARAARVEKLDVGPKGIVVGFREDRFSKPDKLIAWIRANSQTLAIRPDQRLVFKRRIETDEERKKAILSLLNNLEKLAAA
ncbi:MAG: transcription-repair coupling factor [Alphaproteobacteria bacterium]|nr:transcription-repair coupling factor [Alphaproteobacteria bacterium]